MEKFLVVIDMQNDFVDGSLGTAEAQGIVPNVVRRIEDALDAGSTLVFTQDTHHDDYLSTHEGHMLPVKHCVEGTEGWKVAPAISPFVETTLKKPTFGCLALVSLLSEESRAQGKNLDISLCGLCTDICVVSNALLLRAYFPEATIRVFADSTAGSTPQKHEEALSVMRSCQIEIA